MEYLKTIIVEDELNSSDLLCYFLEKYCPMLALEGVAQNLDEAKKMIAQKKPDLVFLDIHLGDKNAFDLFKENDTPNYQIIFTTAFDQYAIDAFKVNAIDYLLKPIDISDLKKAVKKAVENFNKNTFLNKQILNDFKNVFINHQIENHKMIAISSQKEILLIKDDNIISCSANGKYTVFSLVEGEEIVSSKNIGIYEKYLTPPKFFRIHNSHIINLNHLVKIDRASGGYCELSNGKVFPLAKRRREELKNLFNF